jgi:Tfp pilus assembly protein PilF
MRRIPFHLPATRQFAHLGIALAGLLVCGCGIWSAVRAGASRLLSDYGSGASQLVSVDEAVRWNFSDPEAHQARALVQTDMGLDKEALKEFERAVALRPADYYLWLELGHAREEVEDVEGARAAFRKALSLAPDYAQPHWQLGNILLRAGEFDEAFVEMRRASASDAELFPAMIDLAWGIYQGDTNSVLKAAQPDTDTSRLALARFFAAHQAAFEAINLFRTVRSHEETEDRRALIKELLAAGNFYDAREVWYAGKIGEKDEAHSLFDGGFEREIDVDEQGFGWKPFRGAQTVRFALDATGPHTGLRCLRLEYSGNFGTDTPVISQLVLVKPHTRYRLSYAARTHELVTASLPLVAIRDAVGDKDVLAQSDALTRGTGEWQDYKIVFETGSVMRAVLISIQRQKCTTSPCPIFGRAWFDTFLLDEL